MLFTVVTDNPQKFSSNPLVLETIHEIEECDAQSFYLVDGFDKALSIYDSINYLDSRITDNIYWFDSGIDDFAAKYLREKMEQMKMTSVMSSINFNEVINYEDERISAYFNPALNTCYLSDKRISSYFNFSINGRCLTYDNTFKLKIKQLGLVSASHTLKSLSSYLYRIFGDEYWGPLLIIFSGLAKKKEKFIADYDVDGQKRYMHWEIKNAWLELFKVEDYLSKVKIYSIDSHTIDLNFTKDLQGRYYVRYDYNGAEVTTGRIYAAADSFQSLQNLRASDRNILKAEDGCYLLELDYKSFEFEILLCLLGEKTGDDDHQKIIDYLGIKALRDVGKGINYSVIYGKSISKISEELATEYGMGADELKRKLLEYPVYKKAIEFGKILRDDYYLPREMLLKNYFNRWIKVEKEYAILNNFIQSTGADFLFMKFNLIVDFLSTYSSINKILLQNHDSMLIQLEISDESESMFDSIINIANVSFKDIKLEVSCSYGYNWGEMTKKNT